MPLVEIMFRGEGMVEKIGEMTQEERRIWLIDYLRNESNDLKEMGEECLTLFEQLWTHGDKRREEKLEKSMIC